MKLNRSWSIALLLGLLSTTAWAFGSAPSTPTGRTPSFRVVSDIDDTVKMTNVANKPAAVWNGLFTKNAFPGMARLYHHWILNQDLGKVRASNSPLRYLTGSPTVIEDQVVDFLVENRFPIGRLFLRNWLKFQSVETHKTTILEKLSQSEREPKILVGDDTEVDANVYAEFKKKHPEQTLAIYIRQVSGKTFPEDVRSHITLFMTPLDLIDDEIDAGRLTLRQAQEMGKDLVRAEAEDLVPEFAFCPQSGELPRVSKYSELMEITLKVRTRVFEICAARAQEN